MAFRVIMIENEVDIHIKLNQLVIRKEGKETWVPLDDISVIVMDNLSSKVTVRTLCQLSEQGIGMIVCNQQHLPPGYYGAYDNHSRASKVLGYQINKMGEFSDYIWKEIIRAKIINQAKAYDRLKADREGKQRILDFAEMVENGDITNREAHAAKVYFNLLMGVSFSRGNADLLLNSGLDYGYAIIRGYLARLCVGYGLNTQIGIHHKNEYNRFNLVDDLIEPIRPFVDIVAYPLLENELYFKPEHRRHLVNLLNAKIFYRNKKMFFCSMLDNYVEQFASVIMGRADSIIYPDLDDFIGEEQDEV